MVTWLAPALLGRRQRPLTSTDLNRPQLAISPAARRPPPIAGPRPAPPDPSHRPNSHTIPRTQPCPVPARALRPAHAAHGAHWAFPRFAIPMFSRSAFDRHRSRYFPFAAHVSPQPSDPRTRVPRTEPALIVRHHSTHPARPVRPRLIFPPASTCAPPPISSTYSEADTDRGSALRSQLATSLCRVSNSRAGQHSTDFHLTALLRTPTVNQNRVEPRTR
ncbi:hypothetical protein HETIRDRAFT_104926 [Heterobasidion irregulare TC 32-1]|uniref:Uncharacterized protein n=1 Tax=Heterobasidion irregulare (strain TC 32-1) TaxID=747525 RepID=W4K723_HETIT|nr:uncharacterized protein HETIRDRAFT_104926 [Heterobasidion irregulare TC 32-1]ETW81608.1 hypothetical protein HETIRDRAFT_104926 [Heterobasidion irregulare TC 32-1]